MSKAPNKPLRISKRMTIATYNVRSLTADKQHQLIAGCTKNKIDLVAIQEHRQRLETDIDYQMVASGTIMRISANSNGVGGIGLYVSARLYKYTLSCSKISERILLATFEGNPVVTIVACYAPTEAATREEKDDFYAKLESTLQEIPAHNMLILLGDFNARIGTDSFSQESRAIGQFLHHSETNNNGLRLLELCQSANLCVLQSKKPQRKGRQWTWRHPNGASVAQIDHIIIRAKWFNSFSMCRPFNSVNVESDHRILCAKMDVSLRSSSKDIKGSAPVNWKRLNDPQLRESFKLELRNRFTGLSDEVTVQDEYDELIEHIQKSGEKTLGIFKRTKDPDWVSEETKIMVEKRDIAKRKYYECQIEPENQRIRNEWKTLGHEVKKAYEQDEIKHLEGQLKELRIADSKNQSAKTWKLINSISGRERKAFTKVRSTKGSKQTSEKELLDEWKSYFEKLLNAENCDTYDASLPKPAEKDLNIETGNFRIEELRKAIESLNNNKSPGFDSSVTSEVLKEGGDLLSEQLLRICNKVLCGKTPPWQWTTNKIVPVPKKGDLSLMSNYRGISLMSTGAKIFNKMILNRIRPFVEPILRVNQAGFRPGRGTIEMISSLRRLIEGSAAKQIPLVITFVDFRKAFDSVNRKWLFTILRVYGIPQLIVDAIASFYSKSRAAVAIGKKLSDEFDIKSGVLQGDVLAPYLFIIVIDYVMCQSQKECGFIYKQRISRRNPEEKVSDLDYADDIALLESTIDPATKQLDKLSKEARIVGLEINAEKTECMMFNQSSNPTEIKLSDFEIRRVEDFKYLGSKLKSCETDFIHRRSLAWAAYWKLEKIWKAKHLPIKLKANIFETTVISVLLYGCEAWIVTKDMERKMNSFATTCFRMWLGIRPLDKVSNEEVYKTVEQKSVVEKLRKRQLSWVGHALRRNASDPARVFCLYEPEVNHGSIKRGRKSTTFFKYISGLLFPKEVEVTKSEIESLAVDRRLWKKHVAECCNQVFE